MLLYNWLENAVKHKGGGKALIYRDTYFSWRGLLHRVDRRASEFESMGVRAGDLVGLMLGNVPDFVFLSLALAKLRAAPLPLDPTTSTRELEMLMAVVPLRGLITRPRGGDAPLPSDADDDTGERKHIPETRKRLQGTLLSCSIYPCPPQPVPRKKADQIAAVLITADSAGDPKPVERTSGNLVAEAEHIVAALQLTDADRALLTVPLFHSFGFDLAMAACFSVGATLYLEDEIAPPRVLKLAREQKITVLPGNQSLFVELAKLPASRPFGHKGIRCLSLGGGLGGTLSTSFQDKYGIRPMGCFHTTETGTVSIDAKGQSGDTVGKALEHVEVRLTDPKNGKNIAGTKKGVLWIRSAAVSPLKLASKTNATGTDASKTHVGTVDADHWFRSGDLASIDRAKRIKLVGREDDLVRVDGKRVALGEVEGCIETYPQVNTAQATLITDPLGGPMVIAKVVLKGKAKGVDPEEIIDHCARNLAPYKVPRRIEICDAL